MATQMLENKLSVLQALNTTVEGDSDERMTLNIQGTGKAIQIDLNKLKDAVKFIDNTVAEQKLVPGGSLKLEDIDLSDISEKDFLRKAVDLIGPLKKTPNKTLAKDSFIKVFKYQNDFAKLRAKDVKQKA